VPSVHIIDEIFVVASQALLRDIVCDEARWAGWFPGLTLTLYEDRGLNGVRWQLTGDLVGTAEVWLEESGDGTIVHTYLRGEPAAPHVGAHRIAAKARSRYALPVKQHMFEVKDALETDRVVGLPRVPIEQRVVSPPFEQRLSRQARSGTATRHRPADEGAAGDGRPDDVEHPDRG
jgi:hypothetical protein